MKASNFLDLRRKIFKKTQLVSIALLFLFVGCLSGKQDEMHEEVPAPAQESYINDTLGWSIKIPPGFKSLSDHRLKINEDKGRGAISGADKVDATANSLRHLVNFQKNQFNQFSATLQPYDQHESGSYEKSMRLTNKAIFDAYARQKIKIDTVSGKETIAGLSFNTFYIKIYGPNGKSLMNQIIYSTLIRGSDFSVNINYDNDADKKTMLEAFKASSF